MAKTITRKVRRMPRKPVVSVLMPVYNAREYLPDALDSILAQTLDSFELLIIDDHSTDGSWGVLQKYAKKDARIRIFRNGTKNLGLVKSLNKLIPLSRGTFVARMDADDIALPARFAKQVAYLKSHPAMVACGGQEYIINEHGISIAEKNFPLDPATCRAMITNVMVIQPPLLMARGNVFRSLRYDNHIFKNDDISMHFKLLQLGEFGNVPDIIFKYRRLHTSLTHRNPKKVYFLALLVRLNAMRRYGFRPPLVNALLAVAETAVVAVLPNGWIVSLFEWLRYAHNSARTIWRSSISGGLSAAARSLILLLG